MFVKTLIACAAVMSMSSWSAYADDADRTLHKVTIAVAGMMKSKSGAT